MVSPPLRLSSIALQVLEISFIISGIQSQSPCGLCSNTSSTFNAAKPYPFPNQSPPQQWSSITELSCGGIHSALSAYDSTTTSTCPDPNSFVSVSFDMAAYCECSNAKAPRLCGDLCPPGSAIPPEYENMVAQPETGNELTCREIGTLVNYTKVEDVCIQQEVQFILDCCLSDGEIRYVDLRDNMSVTLRNGTTEIPSMNTSTPTTPTPASSATNTTAPTTLPPTSINASNVPTESPTNSSTTTPEPTVVSVSPTTLAPTSAAPTNNLPTTALPTTSQPISAAPTTGPPSIPPTTSSTASAPTTTSVPATPTSVPSQQPTTGMPTTAGPTVPLGGPTIISTTLAPTTAGPTGNYTGPPTTSSPPTPLVTKCDACNGNLIMSNTLPDGALCGDWLVEANQYDAASEECLLEQVAGVEYCGCEQPPNGQLCQVCGSTTALPDARGLTCESLVGMVNIDGFRTCNILSTKYSSLCECPEAVDPVCSFCQNDIDFTVNKPFPTAIDLSVPLPNVFGDVTDLSCRGLADIYAVQTGESCSAIGSNFFGKSQFDLRAWCECPGVSPPQVCGDLCVGGTTVPDDRQDLIPDPVLGLTCRELDGRVKYLSDPGACTSIQALRPLCCANASTPTTVAPTTANPTVQSGNPTRRPSEKPSPRPTTGQPTAGPTPLPPTKNSTTAPPTTDSPTVRPGNPTVDPTTAAPTTLTPTLPIPTVSPTSTIIVVPVNSTFRMYNTNGLTSVEASQPGNALVLNTAWIDFVAKVVANSEAPKIRQLRSSRRLEVTLIPNTSRLDGIMDVTCPPQELTIPEGSNCQEVLGRYDLRVTDDEDPNVVQERYSNETAAAIDEGGLQESMDLVDPKSPFTIAGTAIDEGSAQDKKMEWWLILFLVLSCAIVVCGIACIAYMFTRPKKPKEPELALKLIEENQRPPDDTNNAIAKRTDAGDSLGHDDDSSAFYNNDDRQTEPEHWREPDPTVTIYAYDISDSDDCSSEVDTEGDDEFEQASLPNTMFDDDDDDDEDAQQSYCVSEMTNTVFDGPVDDDEDDNEVTAGKPYVDDPPENGVTCDPPEGPHSPSSAGEDPSVWPKGKDPSINPTSASLSSNSNGENQVEDKTKSSAGEGDEPEDPDREDDHDHEVALHGDGNDDASSTLVYSMSVTSRGIVDMLDDSTAGQSDDTDALLASAARQLAGEMQS